MIGIMLKTVKLTGTDLQLIQGQQVKLTPATNIPNGHGRFYAQPAHCCDWGDNAILLDVGDVECQIVLAITEYVTPQQIQAEKPHIVADAIGEAIEYIKLLETECAGWKQLVNDAERLIGMDSVASVPEARSLLEVIDEIRRNSNRPDNSERCRDHAPNHGA